MSNTMAKFSRIVGAALLSHLLLLSKKGRQPSTSPSLVTGIERKNMSQIFFSPKETRLFPEDSEEVAVDLVCSDRKLMILKVGTAGFEPTASCVSSKKSPFPGCVRRRREDLR